ncbi:GNAT family N-acetyltransferase [Actinomycetospora straminea]|uniref:GNAT family N-acetyltransferase n=1 Tax=Actinomycetospora straminea TaxID=663607 RepID=A0ABP9ENU6_9PSEU|nr:GNAT family N-acetyltransferase [Actinomycetospora straminea]MDD7933481.1 GNAT family N-acetyltransferase [Actinomycetospora straminea]
MAPGHPGPLDEPVRSSLLGAHAHLAQGHGDALRYDPDAAPFLAEPRSAAEWDDVAALVGPGGTTVVPAFGHLDPVGLAVGRTLPGVQLVGDDVAGHHDPGLVRLDVDDVPAMRDLVARTRPGPFGPRTIAMGTYLGVVEDGELVAMAGERLHPPGYTEISAVCTDPAHRGRGLATRLVLAVAAGVRARGEVPFLHAAADNTGAIRLYETLGFRLRARPDFTALTVPSDVPART